MGMDSRTTEHLRRRVAEEAEAAVRATSVRATIIHVTMATAYARSLREAPSEKP
jgi:hypothetical protein